MGYSIVIRTLGKAGECYRTMLRKIDELEKKPDEVLVVIPYGYELPEERLGYEQFVRSEKGMVYQRCVGGMAAKSEYILFLDDDLAFNSDFVTKLEKPVVEGIADASFPLMLELLPQGNSVINSFVSASAMPMFIGKKNYFLKVLKSGGYSYNKKLDKIDGKYYNSQTAPGACVFIRKTAFTAIHFEKEMWLEQNGYAMGEDQVFFYKLYLEGYKSVCVPSVRFEHLDAKTSVGDNVEKAAFGAGWFKYIFWKRFIYEQSHGILERVIDMIAFSYSFYLNVLVNKVKALYSLEKRIYIRALMQGQIAARYYTLNTEYQKYLPTKNVSQKG